MCYQRWAFNVNHCIAQVFLGLLLGNWLQIVFQFENDMFSRFLIDAMCVLIDLFILVLSLLTFFALALAFKPVVPKVGGSAPLGAVRNSRGAVKQK